MNSLIILKPYLLPLRAVDLFVSLLSGRSCIAGRAPVIFGSNRRESDSPIVAKFDEI